MLREWYTGTGKREQRQLYGWKQWRHSAAMAAVLSWLALLASSPTGLALQPHLAENLL